jgi:hypothetical protein
VGSARGLTLALVALASVTVSGLTLAGSVLHRAELSPRGRWAPTHAVEVHPAPLGVGFPAPPGQGGYTLLATQRDGTTPVAWDPCRPIHYVVRPDGAPADGDALVAAAIARVEEATGLTFVDDGRTTEVPVLQRRPMYQPARYGDRWAPVLIAWADADEVPLMAGVLGRAGPSTFDSGRPGGRRYVSGLVVLSRSGVADLISRGREGQAEGVVLHELGHLVGLDHSGDPHEVMYSESFAPYAQYMAGDLRGLALLGLGSCFRDY